jgi:hypothetical protein
MKVKVTSDNFTHGLVMNLIGVFVGAYALVFTTKKMFKKGPFDKKNILVLD